MFKARGLLEPTPGHCDWQTFRYNNIVFFLFQLKFLNSVSLNSYLFFISWRISFTFIHPPHTIFFLSHTLFFPLILSGSLPISLSFSHSLSISYSLFIHSLSLSPDLSFSLPFFPFHTLFFSHSLLLSPNISLSFSFYFIFSHFSHSLLLSPNLSLAHSFSYSLFPILSHSLPISISLSHALPISYPLFSHSFSFSLNLSHYLSLFLALSFCLFPWDGLVR